MAVMSLQDHPEPRIIDSWGHLKLIEEYREPLKTKGPNGLYLTGEHGPLTWKLRCNCGKVFEIHKQDFPGKSKMRNCGPDCSASINQPEEFSRRGRPRLAFSERKHMHSFSVSYGLIERLRLYADGRHLSDSAAASELMELALSINEQVGRKPPVKGDHKKRDGKVDGAIHG